MAIPFLNNITLNNNEVQNVKLHNTSSAPNNAGGQIYFDTSDNLAKYYSNGTDLWIDLKEYSFSNGTYIDVTTAGTTAKPILTLDISATGTPGTGNFLRGDNTWATPANDNTTYDLSGFGTTNGTAGVQLVGSDATTDQVSITGSGTTTVTHSGNTITVTSNDQYTGTVTSVTSGNTNTITISGTAADPTVAANTAAVTNGSLNLATGDQIYDFVVGYADPAGTDNSTDVTLAGSLDYITISGQVITRNAIDLATDVTGTLPIANGGTGQTTAAAAANALLNTDQGGSLTIGVGTDNIIIPGDLTVTGTTTTNNVEVVSTSNGVIFEGNVADANELTLLAGTLSADRTITLPDATGTVALTSDLHNAVTLTNSPSTYDYLTISGQAITLNQIDYNTDIANTPTIPTVNNATITLSAGNSGITMDVDNQFTTNQSGDETITISHADTSSQASVNNSGRTYIQDVTLDDYGHVTGLVSATETVTDTQLATAAALIDVSAMSPNTTASFTHSLASKNLIVQMYDVVTGEVVFADIDHTSNNAISVIFSATPTNDIRVVVIDAKNGLTDKTVSYS